MKKKKVYEEVEWDPSHVGPIQPTGSLLWRTNSTGLSPLGPVHRAQWPGDVSSGRSFPNRIEVLQQRGKQGEGDPEADNPLLLISHSKY